jgi:hypothetical protein
MADTGRVNEVLRNFHEWAMPWRYIHVVLAQRGLQSPEIQLINELWAEATDAKHWVEPSFQTSDELIRQKFGATYPWLGTPSIDSLIRGASYVWK